MQQCNRIHAVVVWRRVYDFSMVSGDSKASTLGLRVELNI